MSAQAIDMFLARLFVSDHPDPTRRVRLEIDALCHEISGAELECELTGLMHFIRLRIEEEATNGSA